VSLILCLKKSQKGKVFARGNTLNLLLMIVAISKAVAERIAIEKNLDIDQAIRFLCDCIVEGHETLI